MQGVDLVTYLCNRRLTIVEKHPKAAEQKTLMWAKILPAVQRGIQRLWPA